MSFLKGKKAIVKKEADYVLSGQTVTIVDGPLLDNEVF